MSGALEKKFQEYGIPYRTDVCAALLSTFRIGGIVGIVAEPRCEGELLQAATLCRACGAPYAVIGNGSNLLFEDGRIETVIIRTVALDAVRITKTGAHASCGVPLPKLSALTARAGFSGLQFACGIPGTLGGGLAMNAGAHGKCLSDVVRAVRIWDPDTCEIKTDINFKWNTSYRNIGYKDKNTVFLSADLVLEPDKDPEVILAEIKHLKVARAAAQPLQFPNAGCAFCRPHPDLPIGKLLDELGCKGMAVGAAAVSQKHAAFIVNRGGASANDVKKLMLEIKKKVEKERGIILQSEIRIIPSGP